jgi:hypothetical protein
MARRHRSTTAASKSAVAHRDAAISGGTIDCFSAGILVADHLCAPIDHLPAAGELVLTDDLPLQIGGCAANTAIDLARLGVRVGILGCVGQDPSGGSFTCSAPTACSAPKKFPPS